MKTICLQDAACVSGGFGGENAVAGGLGAFLGYTVGAMMQGYGVLGAGPAALVGAVVGHGAGWAAQQDNMRTSPVIFAAGVGAIAGLFSSVDQLEWRAILPFSHLGYEKNQ